MHEVKEKLRMEMDEIADRIADNGLTERDLDMLYKIASSYKNLCKIEMLEEDEGGYSKEGRDGGYSRRRGYSRGMGDWEARGEYYNHDGDYSRRGGSSYEGGISNRRRRDRMGRYASSDGKEAIHKLREAMNEVEDPKDKEAIQKCIDQMEE